MYCLWLQSVLPSSSPDDHCFSADVEWSLIYSVVWACGGFLTASNKTIFDKWWHDTFTSNSFKFHIPDGESLWDHFHKPGSLSCGPSANSTPLSICLDRTSSLFFSTVRSAAMAHLLNCLIHNNVPVLLDGASGSGKSSFVKHTLLKHAESSDMKLLHIHYDMLTSATDIWNQISENLEWDWGKSTK